MTDLEEAKHLAYRQIVEINNNGCAQFKCKKCVLNQICDHFPDHSKEIAYQMILMARSK